MVYQLHPLKRASRATAAALSRTAQALERLPPGWYITHDVKVGSRGANFDHVVTGPPGVFVINSKYHGEKEVLVYDDVYIRTRRTGHIDQGRREAERASTALSRRLAWEVRALSLIVVVAVEYGCIRQPTDSCGSPMSTEQRASSRAFRHSSRNVRCGSSRERCATAPPGPDTLVLHDRTTRRRSDSATLVRARRRWRRREVKS